MSPISVSSASLELRRIDFLAAVGRETAVSRLLPFSGVELTPFLITRRNTVVT